MEIRELRAEDRPSLRLLIAKTCRDSPEAMNFEKEPSEKEIDDLISKKLEGVRNRELIDFVALDKGAVIADCEILGSSEGEGSVGIIVSKEHRRRGIGRRLLGRCMKGAQDLGLAVINAEIMSVNRAAIAFFLNSGFQQQTLKSDSKEGKTVMSKSLAV